MILPTIPHLRSEWVAARAFAAWPRVPSLKLGARIGPPHRTTSVSHPAARDGAACACLVPAAYSGGQSGTLARNGSCGDNEAMEPVSHEITHVSDTALMTAACRALETERSDGLIRDPFAARLAGERGMTIARNLARLDRMCFGVGVRSYFLDKLVRKCVAANGVTTVINMGAGLDTRPWRLKLPASLRWIEVDFPAILDYKDSVLAGTAPRCRRERMDADLSSEAGRARVFAEAAGAPTLAITEGLLMYLPGETVEALAEGANWKYWALDVSSPALVDRVGRETYKDFQGVRSPGHLDGLETMDVLRRHGWNTLRHLAYGRDALWAAPMRILRMIRSRPKGQKYEPPPPGDPSGIHLLGRRPGSAV